MKKKREHKKIVWVGTMIVSELAYLMYMESTFADVKPWLLSMYVDYSEEKMFDITQRDTNVTQYARNKV